MIAWATNASSVAPIPMDTSNPWDMGNRPESGENITTTTTSAPSIEADSWADFSSFTTTEFSSSIMTTSNNNGVTTSCALSSSENRIVTSGEF